ncbi:MAG: hypothetical protein AAF543_17610, partial [Pseudomonadota bacterium]
LGDLYYLQTIDRLGLVASNEAGSENETGCKYKSHRRRDQETALAAVLQGREIRPDDAVVYYSREGVDCFAVLERDPSLADRIYANDGGSLRWIDIIFQAIEASPLSRLDAHIKT